MKTSIHSLAALLTVLFFSAPSLRAQEHDTLFHQVSYRIFFTPQMQYRSVFSNAVEQLAVQERNETEIAQIGYTTGIGAEYSLSEHWTLTAGLAVSERGYQTRLRNLQFVSQTAQEQSLIRQSYVSYRFFAIDVPFGVMYRFAHENKWTFYATLEAMPSFAIQRTKALWVNSENTWTATQTSRTRGFDRIPIFLKGSFGADYRISTAFALRASAQFQHSLTSVNPNLATRDYLYAGGLEIGLLWTP